VSNDHLQAIGDSFVNIGAAIRECARSAGANSAPPVDYFQQSLDGELRRLRASGEDGLASAIDAIRAPLSRLMTMGW